MTKEQFLNLAEKHANGTASDHEIQLVELIYDQMQSDKTAPEWEFSAEEEIRLRILSSITHVIKPEERTSLTWRVMRIAASVLLVVGVVAIVFLISNTTEPVEWITSTTHMTQRKTVTLPDGSTVRLNMGSELLFPEKFSENSRSVTLKGEGFFEVVRDESRPFTVLTESLTTTVLGTSFNVRAYTNEDQDVTVVTGKVKVENQHSKIILSPGEQAYFDVENRALVRNEVDPSQYAGWTDPELRFDLVPFQDIVTRLERWYRIDIEVMNQEKAECLIRANYKNKSISYVLNGLQNIVSFEYEMMDDRTIRIVSYGCKK